MNNAEFKLGECTVLPHEHAIKFDGVEKESLQPKFIEVLVYLASQYPRVIPRQELIDEVWAGNDYVGEKALTNAIWHLRKKLKLSDEQPDVIETIRKVGYKLKVEPLWIAQPEDLAPKMISASNEASQKRALLMPSLVVVIAVLIAALAWLKYSSGNDASQVEVLTITKDPGSELFVSPSPDGQRVVYKWTDSTGESNLYLRDVSQPSLEPKQLTFDSEAQGISSWSPDGINLYFAKRNLTTRDCNIVQLNTLAMQESIVTQCPRSGGYYYIDVSPDGKTLAYHGLTKGDNESGIYFLKLDNPDAQPVRFSCDTNCGYKDRDVAFSPDGQTLAITRRNNRFSENVFLVNLNDGTTQQVTHGEEDIVGISWHPSGDKLVYAAQQADVRNGYVYDLNDKEIYPLNVTGFSYPEFARKEGGLFFQQRKEKYHIASLNLNNDIASSPFPVIQSDFSHHYPDYSEVADKIAYVSNESGYYELWLASPTGKKRERITELKRTIRYPKWSPDGKKIAFLAPADNQRGERIFIINVDTQRVFEVPTKYQRHNRPTWTPDGRHIISAIYTDSYTDLFKIHIETGNAQRITFDSARYGVAIDEGTLIYSKTRGGLWQKPLSPTKDKTPIISGKSFNVLYSWVLAKDKVYYRHEGPEVTSIMMFNFATQRSQPIFLFPYGAVSSSANLSYVSKYNKLIYPQADLPQADIKKLLHPLITN